MQAFRPALMDFFVLVKLLFSQILFCLNARMLNDIGLRVSFI